MKLGKISRHFMSPQLINFHTFGHIDLSIHTFI